MKRTAVVVAITLVLLVLAVPAKSANQTICVLQPTHTPGDYWEYQKSDGTKTYREFIGREGDYLVFQNRAKDTFYTDLNLVDLRGVDTVGKEFFRRTAPGGYIEFPLWVGKKWSASYSAFRGHFWEQYFLKHRVVAFEEVATKGGRFHAFRIEWKEEGATCKCVSEYTYWYSPQVKNFIKFREPNEKNSRELVKFNVQP